MTPRVALFVLLSLAAGPMAGCRRVLIPSEPAPAPSPTQTPAPVIPRDTSAAAVPRAAAPQAPRFAVPAVPREMRAVWVATVENMDWPSRPGLSAEQQQRELLA